MTSDFVSRSKTIDCAVILLLPILFLFCPCAAFSEKTVDDVLKPDEELEEELQYLKAETYVITPSKIPQRIEKAPGTIHVVTDRQIRQMGARVLADVIETVPGWWVFYVHGSSTHPFVRGSAGSNSSRVLLMMNSQPLNEVERGGALELYESLDLDNVKRIEFVSGPASALYGSGAMAGVINIITKEGEDVDGLQLTGRAGSFNTWEGNALFGKTIEDLEVAAYVDYRTTDGFRGHVDQDQQSILDELYGTHASLAPGNMKGDLVQWDAQLTLKYKGFKFDGKYIDKKREMPFGPNAKLDEMSNYHNREYYLNLGYDLTVTEGLDLLAKVYRNQEAGEAVWQYWPKGSIFGPTPTGPEIASENRFVEGESKSSRMGAEAQATYEILDANTIVGGFTYEEQRLYDITVRGNFVAATPAQDAWIQLPSVQDWPDEYLTPNKTRTFWAAYVEDIWDIRDDLRLTIGGRYDHYSDFGGEFSPRVGINWEFARNFYTKFLYGRAFRAPYFRDLYDVTDGNPDLKAEISDSYEWSLGAKFPPSFTGQVTFAYSEAKDLIVWDLTGSPPSLEFINRGTAIFRSVVLQMKYDFGRGTYLGMNFTHLNLDFYDPDLVPYFEPQRFGTLTANIRLNRYLNLNTYLLYRGDWTRAEGDTRDDPEDYVTVNATLIAKNFLKELKGLEVRGSVLNLFDKEYTHPTGPGELPNDVPRPGINFFVELRYTF